MDLEISGHFEVIQGGSYYARFQKLSFERFRVEAIAEGWASEADFAIAMPLFDQADFMYSSNVTFSALGRRPA